MSVLINCTETGDAVMAGILKAINFAAIKHSFQKRKDAAGTPYSMTTIHIIINRKYLYFFKHSNNNNNNFIIIIIYNLNYLLK